MSIKHIKTSKRGYLMDIAVIKELKDKYVEKYKFLEETNFAPSYSCPEWELLDEIITDLTKLIEQEVENTI